MSGCRNIRDYINVIHYPARERKRQEGVQLTVEG
jgi:hypothetical protein